QRVTDLPDDGNGFFRRELSFVVQQLAQVAAFDELHGDVLCAFRFRNVVNADDIAVSNLPCGEEFLLESSQNYRMIGHFRPNHFQSDQVLDLTVARFVDGAHAAFAEEPQDFVAAAKQVAGSETAAPGVNRRMAWLASGWRGRRINEGRVRFERG